jgi:hypothetical protein
MRLIEIILQILEGIEVKRVKSPDGNNPNDAWMGRNTYGQTRYFYDEDDEVARQKATDFAHGKIKAKHQGSKFITKPTPPERKARKISPTTNVKD